MKKPTLNFLKNPLENKFGIWFLLGPTFLILSLSLSTLQVTFPNWDFWILTPLGMMLCWTFEIRGFFLILSALLLSSFWKHFFLSVPDPLWQVGLESSLILGFWIVFCSFEELKKRLAFLNDYHKHLNQKISFVEENLKREQELHLEQQMQSQKQLVQTDLLLEKKDQELLSIEEVLSSLKNQQKQLLQEKEHLQAAFSSEKETLKQKISSQEKLFQDEKKKFSEELLNEKERLLATLSNEMESLKQKISSQEKLFQDEKKKISKELLNEKDLQAQTQNTHQNFLEEQKKREQELLSLREEKEKSQKELKTLSQALSRLEKEKQDLKEAFDSLEKTPKATSLNPSDKTQQALYLQLKKQFQEKTEHLHQVRAELFHTQEGLLAERREKELALREEYSFEKEFALIQEELQSYEKEIQQLKQLVSFLTEELAKKAPPKKKKVSEETFPSLFPTNSNSSDSL